MATVSLSQGGATLAQATVTVNSTQPLFDGRAALMTQLESYETTPGTLSTLVQVQQPALWDALSFLNNDIKLVPSSRYVQAYQVTVGLNSHNPYYTPSDGRSSELSKIRPISLGQWDWYANAYQTVAPFTSADWMLVDQFGYPGISSPPLSIHCDGGQWNLQQWAGLISKNSAGNYRAAVVNTYPIAPLTNDLIEIITGVKWATDNTGALRCYWRLPLKTSTWTLALSKDNLPTEQYGTTPSGTVSADFHDCPTVTDHGGLYFGYWAGSAGFPNPFPVNTVLRQGVTRWPDLASAKTAFPT